MPVAFPRAAEQRGRRFTINWKCKSEKCRETKSKEPNENSRRERV